MDRGVWFRFIQAWEEGAKWAERSVAANRLSMYSINETHTTFQYFDKGLFQRPHTKTTKH